jgi:class 3 adenylate cyclase
VGCQASFDLHLDRDVRVTFSASERLRRARGGELVPLAPDADDEPATRGLDLLLVPAFWELKTIGDAVMASFASGTDAVRAAFQSQAELCARAQDMDGELVLKAGVLRVLVSQ